MPVPRLLHPVEVEIKQKDEASTFYDDDAREPIQVVRRSATVTLPGLVNWGSSMSFRPGRGGAIEESEAYIIFRVTDLQALGMTLQRGDLITRTGKTGCKVYIVRLEPQAHYPDQGGATLMKAYVEDRQPGVE